MNRLDELRGLLDAARSDLEKARNDEPVDAGELWLPKSVIYAYEALFNHAEDLLAVCRAAGELRGAVDVFGGGRNVPKLVARFDGALLRPERTELPNLWIVTPDRYGRTRLFNLLRLVSPESPIGGGIVSYDTYEVGQPWVIYRYGRTHDGWWPPLSSTRVMGRAKIDVECAICGNRSVLTFRMPRFGPIPPNTGDPQGRHPARVAYLKAHAHPDRKHPITWAKPLANPAALQGKTDVLDVIKRRVINPLRGEEP